MITRIACILFMFLASIAPAFSASDIVGASAKDPNVVCKVYSQGLTPSIPATFTTRGIAAFSGPGTAGYLLASQAAAPNDIFITQFLQTPFTSTGPISYISSADSPIRSSRIMSAKIGTGVQNGKLFVLYVSAAAKCSAGDCLGVERYNNGVLEAQAFLVTRITNFFGFTQDDTYLYAFTGGDGTAIGSSYAVLHKIHKTTLTITSSLTVDTGVNGGNVAVDPYYYADGNAVYTTDRNLKKIYRVNLSSFTVSNTSVALNGQVNGFAVVYSGTALAPQLFASTDTANTLYRIDPSTLALNSSVGYPANQLSVSNGLWGDAACNSLHMRVGASAGTVSVQRFRLSDSSYQDTFSTPAFQNGVQSTFHLDNHTLFLDNGATGLTSVISATVQD